jgi:hypothetical protein
MGPVLVAFGLLFIRYSSRPHTNDVQPSPFPFYNHASMRKTTLKSTSPLSDIPLIQGRDEVDDSRLQLLIQLEYSPPIASFSWL